MGVEFIAEVGGKWEEVIKADEAFVRDVSLILKNHVYFQFLFLIFPFYKFKLTSYHYFLD